VSPENRADAQGPIIEVSGTKQTRETAFYSDTDRAQFWAKARVTPTCWLWQGSINRQTGYGSYAPPRSLRSVCYERQPVYAHRFAWTLTHGPIPAGQHVLHACDVPACVNPDHLFLGTHKVNMADAARKGRLHVPRPRRQAVSDEKVASIFLMREQGALLREIADVIGTSITFVSLVLKGKRRQHGKDAA
jgi:hypothetical protein